jgi:transposase
MHRLFSHETITISSRSGIVAKLPRLRGKIVVIWDGSSIHRSKEIQAFLEAGAAKRLHLELLPCYAPDLTPDEGMAHRTF